MTLVRAVHWAARADGEPAPWDTLHLRVYFPGAPPDDDLDPVMGVLGPDRTAAPFPVVVFVPGFNCPPELYTWLGRRLVERGFAFVSFSWVAELFPGTYGLSSGVDLRYARPDTYGSASTAKCLPPILSALGELNAQGVLQGALDLDRIVLGGHSGGGVVALHNTRRSFHPQLAASFTYAAHSSGAPMLGWEQGSIMPVPGEVPVLLTGGTADMVIGNSAEQRYGRTGEDPSTPIRRTFDDAMTGGRGDSYLVLFEGANHFSVTDGYDGSTARGYLDPDAQPPTPEMHDVIASTIGDFLAAHVLGDEEAAQAMKRLVAEPPALVAESRVK